MYSDCMHPYGKFKLTRTERKLMQALSLDRPVSAYSLEKKTRTPHSSTLYALKSLASRELLRAHSYKKRVLWTKIIEEDSQKVDNNSILIHRGKRAMQTLVDDIFTLNAHERLRTLQGEKTFKTWTKVLGEHYIAKLNNRIKANRIIVETIIPSDLFYRAKLPLSFIRSYRGRMTDTRIVPRDVFDFSSDIAMWKDRVCLMNWKRRMAIEIKDPELSKLILSLFLFTQENARKIDINAELRN